MKIFEKLNEAENLNSFTSLYTNKIKIKKGKKNPDSKIKTLLNSLNNKINKKIRK